MISICYHCHNEKEIVEQVLKMHDGTIVQLIPIDPCEKCGHSYHLGAQQSLVTKENRVICGCEAPKYKLYRHIDTMEARYNIHDCLNCGNRIVSTQGMLHTVKC